MRDSVMETVLRRVGEEKGRCQVPVELQSGLSLR